MMEKSEENDRLSSENTNECLLDQSQSLAEIFTIVHVLNELGS